MSSLRFSRSKFIKYTKGSLMLALSFSLLVLYIGSFSHDYRSYLLFHENIQNFSSIVDLIQNHRFEPGFIIVSRFLSAFLSGEGYFIFLAIASLFAKYALFTKYLMHPNFAWLLYIVMFLPALESSQIRTAIATIGILYIILREAPWERILFPMILSSMFHYVALLSSFFYLRRFAFIGVILVPIAFFLLLNLDSIFLIMHSDILPLKQFVSTQHSNSANLLSSVFLAQSFISLIGLLHWKKLNDNQKIGLFFVATGAVLYVALHDNPGVAHRLREVSLLGIFPFLFSGRTRKTYSIWIVYFLILYIALYSLLHNVLRL